MSDNNAPCVYKKCELYSLCEAASFLAVTRVEYSKRG